MSGGLDFGECDTCHRSPGDEGHAPGCARSALVALDHGFIVTPKPERYGGERHVQCRNCDRSWFLPGGPTVLTGHLLSLLDHEAGHEHEDNP